MQHPNIHLPLLAWSQRSQEHWHLPCYTQKQPKTTKACVQPDSPPVMEQRSFGSTEEAPSSRWHYPVANTIHQVTSLVHYAGLDGLRRRSWFHSSRPKCYGVSFSFFFPLHLLSYAKTYQRWHFKISLLTSAQIPGHGTKLKPSIGKAPQTFICTGP